MFYSVSDEGIFSFYTLLDRHFDWSDHPSSSDQVTSSDHPSSSDQVTSSDHPSSSDQVTSSDHAGSSDHGMGTRAKGLFQKIADELACKFRIGFPPGLFHDLAHEHPKQSFFPLPVGLDLLGMIR
jgi:hypothetical protein